MNGQPQEPEPSRDASLRVAFTLSREEAPALLFALDDADSLFMHHRGEELLAFWQRISHALCYLDGEAGYHDTPAGRSLHVTERDALNIWLAIDAAWLRALPPRVRGIVDRCRPSQRATDSLAGVPVLAVDRSWSTPATALTPAVAPPQTPERQP